VPTQITSIPVACDEEVAAEVPRARMCIAIATTK
jgi:hypothetical protein